MSRNLEKGLDLFKYRIRILEVVGEVAEWSNARVC